MLHFGHVIVLAIVDVMAGLTGVAIGVLTINSRSGTGCRDTYWPGPSVVAGVRVDVHTVRDIDPEESSNMNFLLAFEFTHAVPQSF